MGLNRQEGPVTAACLTPVTKSGGALTKQTAGNRLWILSDVRETDVEHYVRRFKLSPIVARILVDRGIAEDTVEAFLKPTLKSTFPDPSSFADLDRGADIVWNAIRDQRPTAVFADYDVDGATSSALLAKYARYFGHELDLYVPDRLTEGYGPSPKAFQTLKDRGAELIVTVDCGAAAREALEAARDIGVEIVVIDHHLMSGSKPPASALINPNRPDCNSGQGHLAAAGVVYVFLAALNQRARACDPTHVPDILSWLDLCALGTLCDMAPLMGVNRAFVRQGLKVMEAGDSVGISALAEVCGIGRPNSVQDATFGLGPRINAGGRVGDPWLAAKLMATDDRNEALSLAEKLNALNIDRRDLEAEILNQAIIQSEQTLDKDPDVPVLVTAAEGWHPGVIGIVAGRLKEKFQRPAIAIGWGSNFGAHAKGSARSVAGINIGGLIAQAAREGVIESGGGHAMAAGLSLLPKQIGAFRHYVCDALEHTEQARADARSLKIDAHLSCGGATRELFDEIGAIGPFGAGAPEPTFVVKNVKVFSHRTVGNGHLKLVLQDDTGTADAIAWRAANEPIGELARSGHELAAAIRLKPNDWKGQSAVQFEIEDMALMSDLLK